MFTVEPHPESRLVDGPLRPALFVAPDTPLATVARLFVEENLSCLLVGVPGELCSIVTERDLARAWRHDLTGSYPVSTVAVPCPLTIPASATMFDAAALMLRYGIRHLVVTDQSKAIGILSIRDALAALVSEHSTRERAAEAIQWALSAQPETWWG
ncbi:MAG: putative signal-transduction protein containing cAMP-binding and domain [Acidimicrobiia bacterium]|nr:putative signal-transduction protein containing cAMP-binding and domain [Acidimicrobiia bacterium]